MSGPDCEECGEHFMSCPCIYKGIKFSRKSILNKQIFIFEETILKTYKAYCEEFPNDEQADQEWLAYSAWINARRRGEVFNDLD